MHTYLHEYKTFGGGGGVLAFFFIKYKSAQSNSD